MTNKGKTYKVICPIDLSVSLTFYLSTLSTMSIVLFVTLSFYLSTLRYSVILSVNPVLLCHSICRACVCFFVRLLICQSVSLSFYLSTLSTLSVVCSLSAVCHSFYQACQACPLFYLSFYLTCPSI